MAAQEPDTVRTSGKKNVILYNYRAAVLCKLYSGIYGRASVTFYAFNTGVSKGIACGLNNLQKIKDGEPLGSHTSAEDDFADEEEYLN